MILFKKCVIALSINIALISSGLACTTLLAGSEATNDGSLIIARSADSSALKAQHFVIHPAKKINQEYIVQKNIMVLIISPTHYQKFITIYNCAKLENTITWCNWI